MLKPDFGILKSAAMDLIKPPPRLEGNFGGWRHLGPEPQPADVVCLDLETFKMADESWVPFCAVLYNFTRQSWSFWLTPSMGKSFDLPSPLYVIGHSVCAYDRQFIQSAYSLGDPHLFFDTQSAAIRLRGASNQQVALYKLYEQGKYYAPWCQGHTPGSLKACAKHWLDIDLDKSTRDDFVGKPEAYYWLNAERIVNYCGTDTYTTALLFQAMLSDLDSFDPRTLDAHLITSTSILPVSTEDLEDYISRVHTHVAIGIVRIEDHLKAKLKNIVDAGFTYQEKIGFNTLDWTTVKGIPKWAKVTPTLKTQIAPIILGTKYEGHPVYFTKTKKSGYWSANGSRIPHPEGKDGLYQFFNKYTPQLIESGVITFEDEDTQSLLEGYASFGLWIAFGSRIKALKPRNNLVIPEYLPWGTISGRGKDPLWLVSPKVDPKKPGSEFRTLAKAPAGYKIVGGDFSSQEMRLFALLGDASQGEFCSSDLAKEVYFGDIHTALSKSSGAPRSVCKNINYGSIYGLGVASGENYCRLAGMTQPRKMAQKIIDTLKGTKNYGRYYGGIGSLCFNVIAQKLKDYKNLKSPILGNPISTALQTDDFATTRQNWCVQTSGSDMRDIFLTRLYGRADVKEMGIQLMLFVHDEPRFLVPEQHAQRFAEILQEVHKETVEEIIKRLGIIGEIPEPLLKFEAIEVDTVWRKTCDDPCLTPTNATPIPPGYAVK